MKKFLLAILIALSVSFVAHSQVRDSLLTSDHRWFITQDSTFDVVKEAVVIYSHEDKVSRKLVFKGVGQDGVDVIVQTNSYTGEKVINGRLYKYYASMIVNNNMPITIGFRYQDDGTFDSIGIINDDGTIVVFWILQSKKL